MKYDHFGPVSAILRIRRIGDELWRPAEILRQQAFAQLIWDYTKSHILREYRSCRSRDLRRSRRVRSEWRAGGRRALPIHLRATCLKAVTASIGVDPKQVPLHS